mgnify:CR=1 FL=1
MNIRQIEIFKAVMESGSVTAASQKLRISQPAVSKYLKLLEEDTELKLFDRTGNRLSPTLEAKTLFDQVERSYRGLDQLSRFVTGLKHHPAGEISVAAMPMLARSWLPEILGPFLIENTDVSLSLPIRSSGWIADALSTGQVDIGIGLKMADSAGVEFEHIMSVPLVCVMKPDHPLAEQTVVVAGDLAPHTLITLSNFDQWRLAVENALDHSNVRPIRRVDTFTTQVACELIERGVGIAIVDALTAIDYAERGLDWRLFRPALSFDIVLMTSAYRSDSLLGGMLIETLRESAAKTEKFLMAMGAFGLPEPT